MHRVLAALSRSGRYAAIALVVGIGNRAAYAQSVPTDTVWVNTRSRVYHCRGTEYYGKTREGAYMVEAAARARGYRANGGRACPPTATRIGDSLVAALKPRDEFGPSAPVGPTVACTLRAVVDGDTVECEPVGPIRLIGIDAPERNEAPHYARSTAALSAFVPIGASILLEGDAEQTDRYNRRLGHLWYNGRLINWYMVRNGWASAYRYPPSIRYAEPLDSAETWARTERRGLWPDGKLPCHVDKRRGKTC